MKKLLFAIAGLMLLCTGCASLSKSQIEAVNHFAKVSSDFSAYPSQIMVSLAELRVKRGVYFANSLDNTDTHVQELNNLYAAMKDDYASSAKADLTFKIIDKYAQALLLLSSDKHTADLDKQAVAFGSGLDSLISAYNKIPDAKPVHSGLGGVVGSLVLAGGNQLIRTEQAKAIEKYVPEADTLVAVMTNNLLEFLESSNIDFLIRNEEKGIDNNFKSFLNQRKSTIENERDFVQLKKDLDHIRALRAETAAATRQLRKTHAELLEAITKKKDLKEVIAALQALYDDVKEVRSTIHQLNTPKQ